MRHTETLKLAKAEVRLLRQTTQYTCCAASLASAFNCLGLENITEKEINRILKCEPQRGASWQDILVCCQYFGIRGELVIPCTINTLKEWTDKGLPVVIGWNPEGRPWSHASIVFDVDDKDNVYIMDPNIPNPDETTRILPKEKFYSLWYEKSEEILVRRPAMVLSREVDDQGRQVLASQKDFFKYYKESFLKK